MDSIAGLPAHPLVVHGAVVLVPLTALGVLVIAISARASRGVGVVVLGFAVVSLVFCLLASKTGEELEETEEETELVEQHAELGDQMPLFAAVMLVTTGALVGADVAARRGGDEPPSWARVTLPALGVVAVLGAGVATWKVVDVGHSGAEAVWSEESGDDREGDRDQVDRDRYDDDDGDDAGEDGS